MAYIMVATAEHVYHLTAEHPDCVHCRKEQKQNEKPPSQTLVQDHTPQALETGNRDRDGIYGLLTVQRSI